jgi:hypothetical protein
MANRAVIVEVRFKEDGEQTGIQDGANSKVNPNTRDSRLIQVWSSFVADADVPNLVADIETAVNARTTGGYAG